MTALINEIFHNFNQVIDTKMNNFYQKNKNCQFLLEDVQLITSTTFLIPKSQLIEKIPHFTPRTQKPISIQHTKNEIKIHKNQQNLQE